MYKPETGMFLHRDTAHQVTVLQQQSEVALEPQQYLAHCQCIRSLVVVAPQVCASPLLPSLVPPTGTTLASEILFSHQPHRKQELSCCINQYGIN